MINSPFDAGDDAGMNACLNYGLDQWDLYTQGYRRGAEVLTHHVRDSRTDQDLLVYPMLYLWRHHLELQIKLISRDASRLLGRKWTASNTHDLSKLFSDTSKLIEECLWQFNSEDARQVTEPLKAPLAMLRAMDLNSVVFRYPEGMAGDAHLADVHFINYAVVDEHMRGISDGLSNLRLSLEFLAELIREDGE